MSKPKYALNKMIEDTKRLISQGLPEKEAEMRLVALHAIADDLQDNIGKRGKNQRGRS